MAKRKKTKGQAMIYKTLHRQLKFEQHEAHQKNLIKLDRTLAFQKVKQFLLH